MIAIKLTRDEARAVQVYFFPFLDQMCSYKKRYADTEEERMTEKIILDQYGQVKQIFAKKLIGTSNHIKFSFTDSQGIILYKLLLKLPLDPANNYLILLRQLICNIVYAALSKELFAQMKQPVETG